MIIPVQSTTFDHKLAENIPIQIEKKWAQIGEGEITLIDPGAKNSRPWIDIGLPTTVVLNQDHKIVYKIVGDVDWSQPDIVSLIKSVH